ncbi:selenocysteine-specific translation elongation factor [Caenimonas aquaedulcis]|uniref:Selenocysteine-specific elongation factor n=1 Tax=Caenimonas aquaedulcis TaxID=2793270 RepID=A0A931H0N7_9BURK|nr:selenocysteine-specific translation elongation factor [Caenimonas aquaedulcis]MBG9386413.1 selenocysteine-specific translation elongation factor [Caenimonas aquaedulcis]
MIVATAGHIDHGKTTLVKALTGVDTDRLPQEKARGISIDIGFAYWQTPGGAVVGFVDVPGHERFVRNMLAGVCGIDYAMVVVAADDGVMPQTREHLNILDLLGIRFGVAVITKADRVDSARLREVADETRGLLQGTSLQDVRVLPVSSVTGAGVDALRDALAQAAAGFTRNASEGRRMRFAVDRAFTVAGSGTVVTGTVFDGAVRLGDRLLLSPGGREVRVRGIQKDGVKAERAQAGERCALNLAGVELSQVQRGDWVLHADLHAPTSRLDVELQVLPGEAHALAHRTPVHLHLGTRDVTARVTLSHGSSVEPGRRAFARLIVDQPIAAARGDRFILRDQSAQRTLGGGWVLDASPSQRRLPQEMRVRQMQALAQPTPVDALRALVACSPGGVDATALTRNFNLAPEAFTQLLKEAGLAAVGTGAQTLVLTPAAADAKLLRKPVQALPENPEHVRLWQLAEPVLRRAGFAGVTVAQLSEALRAKEFVLRDMLHRKAQAGDTVRVNDDRFYARATIDEFIRVARTVAQHAPDGRFTAGKFRDDAGIGRALAVQVLEALDRIGATQRVADVRVMRSPARSPSSESPLQGARTP